MLNLKWNPIGNVEIIKGNLCQPKKKKTVIIKI